MILFFDTETTGKADFKAPFDAPHQPRIVQVAALLYWSEGREIASLNAIIKPEGYAIPEEASAVHGITTERAEAQGIAREEVMRLLGALIEMADVYVAHNIAFDLLMVRRELALGGSTPPKFLDPRKRCCTMLSTKDICKLPGQYGDYKWPKLQESYAHIFGERFEGAHDALPDVRACRDIFFWLLRQRRIQPAAPPASAEPQA